MTSNHRPTLESKRGKVIGIADLIVHARNLPQQTQLKLRSDGLEEKAKRAYDEMVSERSSQVQKKQKGLISEDASLEEETEHEAEEELTVSGSESDSEDEEALMAELAKIKEERRRHKEDAVLEANPLTAKEKPSWRKTAFSNKKREDKGERYTTSVIELDQHKEFLLKYVR